MKSFKLFAAGLFMTVSIATSAQSTTPKETTALANGWNTVYFQWNPSSFVPEKGDDQSFTGLSLGWSKAFSLSTTTPLFLETGVGLQYSFYSEEDDEDFYIPMSYDFSYEGTLTTKYKYNGWGLKVPIHLMYRWDIPNSNISLVPFAGINFRYNLSGKLKTEYAIYMDNFGDLDEEELEDLGFEDVDYNVFDKKDMGGSKNTWKRFQIGWELGVKARFNEKFLVGVSYGSDFSEISKKVKIHTTSITLGYCF